MAPKTIKRKKLDENDDILLSYSRHLERRIKKLENEIQILETENMGLKNEIRRFKGLEPSKPKKSELNEILDKLLDLREKITQKNIEEIEKKIVKIINFVTEELLLD